MVSTPNASLMPRHALIPLIIACALFMETLDSTIISTSLPVIAADLRQDPIALKLALTSYLLSLAIFIPVSGWMADRYGARVIFRAAIVIFTLGSILCGLSGSLRGFVAARIVQGAGGAMMVPVGRLIILRSVPKSELVSALAWLTVPALVGPLMGPPLGGFITTTFNWRWIFFINIPIGLIGILLASRFIDNIREPDIPPLDMTGAVLSAMGLSGLVFGLSLMVVCAVGGRDAGPGAGELGRNATSAGRQWTARWSGPRLAARWPGSSLRARDLQAVPPRLRERPATTAAGWPAS